MRFDLLVFGALIATIAAEDAVADSNDAAAAIIPPPDDKPHDRELRLS